jgi:hypothetical protein
METLRIIHNLVRWLILLFGFWTLISAISGLASKRDYTSGDSRANFFFMLSMDIQLLIGLILYFGEDWFDRLKNIGDNMKDTALRFFTLEHALLMLIAWILVHAGRVAVKKVGTPHSKFKRSLVYFGIALLLILIAIPWPFREEVARPWLRWFS